MTGAEKIDWYAAKGVVAGAHTIRVVFVVGFNCYDVMVDGECAKRIYGGGEREAFRRAECARQLYMPERPGVVKCPECTRAIATDRTNRIWAHNKQEASPGRVAEPCAGSHQLAVHRDPP